MKKILLLLTVCLSLSALEKVEVSSQSFEANEVEKVSYFIGSVHIKKGDDEIQSDRLEINFDKKNRPIRYKATGNVSFNITTEGQNFKGSSDQITYQPIEKKYTASGNVHMTETTKNRTLKGEKITIDRIRGKSKIIGTKNKPVKFTFTVDE